MSSDSDAMLATRGITKRFGGLTAVDGVDLQVEPGEVVGVIGPNGAGKSTLFDCITGSLPADEGSVMLDGEEIVGLAEDDIARRGVVRMFQETRIYGEMTVMENALVSAPQTSGIGGLLRPPGEEARASATELLEFVGLGALANVEAGQLSFGQQKLLEFAMALIAEPDVMLMDEPAGGINPAKLNQLIEYIRDANRERGVTVLLIEHNMEFVMEVADRIYVLAHGERIAEGRPEEIQANDRVIDAYLGRE